jgi:hypothetical protein
VDEFGSDKLRAAVFGRRFSAAAELLYVDERVTSRRLVPGADPRPAGSRHRRALRLMTLLPPCRRCV